MADPTKLANGNWSFTNDAGINTTGTEEAVRAAATAGASAPVATPPPINRTITDPTPDPTTPEGYLDTFTPPQTADQIAESKRKGAQGLIDSTNALYDSQVAAKQQEGQGRVDANNAISVLSGLMGSTESVRTDTNVKNANQKEVDAVNAQRAQALSGIYTKISSDAQTEAEQQKQDATKSAEDIIARRKDSQANAVANLKQMAAGGLVDFDSFKNSPQNQQVYNYALQSVGGSEDSLRALFAINRPQDQLVGTPTRVGDHFVQAYKNPITGKVSYDTIPLPPGMGDNYSTFQKMGDNLVAIPDGWDGDVTKLKTIVGQPSAEDALRIQGLQLDNQKKAKDLASDGAPAGYNGEFSATIALAANQGGTNAQRAQTKATLQTFIADGDYPSAYAAVSDATAKGLKGAAATTFSQQQNSLGVLDSLQTAIKAYSDAGGNTNIFKGSVDSVQNKIGALMTDPKYASLAVQMNAAFQNYRLQMTGAAFGDKESAEYAAILPSPGNTLDLNLTKIDGAKAYLNSSVESSIKSVVGQGGVEIKQHAENGTKPPSADLTSLAKKQGLSDSDLQDAINQYGEDAVAEFLNK